jgi:hypothetical protein
VDGRVKPGHDEREREPPPAQIPKISFITRVALAIASALARSSAAFFGSASGFIRLAPLNNADLG